MKACSVHISVIAKLLYAVGCCDTEGIGKVPSCPCNSGSSIKIELLGGAELWIIRLSTLKVNCTIYILLGGSFAILTNCLK